MISFIVCAFNEEKNVGPTVDTLLGALREMSFPTFEIIIVDDGSSDGTYACIEKLMTQIPQVRCVRHPVNMGMGTAIRSGIAAAVYPQFMVIPGDNDVHHDFILSMLSYHSEAELILSAPMNKEIRSVWRNVVSMFYQMLYMVSFGLFLNYINGPGVWPTERVRQLGLRARRFSIISEMNVKLLRSGCNFAEVPGYFQAGPKVRSTITLRNLLEVVGSYVGLLYEIHIRAPEKFSSRPKRVAIKLINTR
jgi:glycosyltransferase involved in cell wall biosynthesis